MAIASQPLNSRLKYPFPLDAPVETILDLWYTVLGDTVLDYAYDELLDLIPDDWLMNNIRRVVARLIVDVHESKWVVSGTPYTVHWQWNNHTQKVNVKLIMKETNGNHRQQSVAHQDAQP